MKLSRSQLADYLVTNPGKKSTDQVAAYLVSNRRSKEVDLVIREVEVRLENHGRTVARVTSARKLQAEQQKQVIAMLKNDSKTESVEIINDVDPSLLGGAVIRTPSSEVDLSIRSRLNRLKRA